MMSKYPFALLFCLLTVCTAGLAQQPSVTLQLTGLVDRPLTLTIDSLRAMTAQTGGPVDIVSSSGQVRKTIRSFRGVLLRDLLDKARIQLPNQKDKGKYYVVVRGTDGYTAVFSHNELFNNPTGKQVFVLYTENDQPITTDGAFVLLTTDDVVTGARHVKWLNRIEVRKVE
jgi:DMSO/TMAO reductase YedYZ molybdopterin-dependent catalytic subunit